VSEPRLLYIDPRLLVPDADNVRREPGDLDGLAASLRQYGVLQPLGVVPHEDGLAAAGPRYRVVYGNRRRAAAIMAGLSAVPCVPLSLSPGTDQLVAQLLENMQRRDLNDMEKADGLARLRRHLAAAEGPAGESLDDRVATLVGLKPRTVRRYLALRQLPPSVRDLLADGRLTVTQAQHLHALAADRQQEVATRAAAEEWTAALVSRVCAALVRAPGLSVDDALQAAAGGGDGQVPGVQSPDGAWAGVDRLGPAPRTDAGPGVPATPARVPRTTGAEAGGEGDDADLWREDATGAPTPEALGAPDPFAGPGQGSGRGVAGPAGAEPETADGHRVFRIRTLSAFCDEVDRLARCLQDGNLERAVRDDPGRATRLRLVAKQLAFTLQGVERLLE
jgi:ParB family chromosome partitioning protein